MKNLNAPIFMIDFEGSKKIGVVEYGVAEILDGKVRRVISRICAPKTRIPARDADFIGISNNTAKKMPPFMNDIEDFCKMRKSGVFASHNCQVEDSLLRDTMPSPGLVPELPNGKLVKNWAPWIDTCALAKNIYPSLPSAKLSDLIEIFSLKEELDSVAKELCPEGRRQWHCAPYDALAAALLLIKICSQDGFENVTFEWLIKYSANAISQELSF